MAILPGVFKSKLEVEPGDDLHHPTARILSVVDVPVCRRHLAASVAARGASDAEEVDVVEGVQYLAAQLEVDALVDLDPLDRAHVETGEHRAVDNQGLGSAVAAQRLDAIRAIGRRDVASRGRAEIAVAGGDVFHHDRRARYDLAVRVVNRA